jgi:hypothetical protein
VGLRVHVRPLLEERPLKALRLPSAFNPRRPVSEPAIRDPVIDQLLLIDGSLVRAINKRLPLLAHLVGYEEVSELSPLMVDEHVLRNPSRSTTSARVARGPTTDPRRGRRSDDEQNVARE